MITAYRKTKILNACDSIFQECAGVDHVVVGGVTRNHISNIWYVPVATQAGDAAEDLPFALVKMVCLGNGVTVSRNEAVEAMCFMINRLREDFVKVHHVDTVIDFLLVSHSWFGD